MRYGKHKVNEIINTILEAAYKTGLGLEHNIKFEKRVEMIREEHELVDRRVSSLPEYISDILKDFLELRLSYKDMMLKYHCSERNLKGLLLECAESDDRVWNEIDERRH